MSDTGSARRSRSTVLMYSCVGGTTHSSLAAAGLSAGSSGTGVTRFFGAALGSAPGGAMPAASHASCAARTRPMTRTIRATSGCASSSALTPVHSEPSSRLSEDRCTRSSARSGEFGSNGLATRSRMEVARGPRPSSACRSGRSRRAVVDRGAASSTLRASSTTWRALLLTTVSPGSMSRSTSRTAAIAASSCPRSAAWRPGPPRRAALSIASSSKPSCPWFTRGTAAVVATGGGANNSMAYAAKRTASRRAARGARRVSSLSMPASGDGWDDASCRNRVARRVWSLSANAPAATARSYRPSMK
mmetsp:Transcript_29033/g.94605  ORF Transcript_29033/g.94605 Transcript_29033/m.94605 type:complete len:304 (+) Transcript_29033:346-1257(+)